MISFLAVCSSCAGDPFMPLTVMPFGGRAERDRWAAEHVQGTGHAVLLVLSETGVASDDWLRPEEFVAGAIERHLLGEWPTRPPGAFEFPDGSPATGRRHRHVGEGIDSDGAALRTHLDLVHELPAIPTSLDELAELHRSLHADPAEAAERSLIESMTTLPPHGVVVERAAAGAGTIGEQVRRAIGLVEDAQQSVDSLGLVKCEHPSCGLAVAPALVEGHKLNHERRDSIRAVPAGFDPARPNAGPCPVCGDVVALPLLEGHLKGHELRGETAQEIAYDQADDVVTDLKSTTGEVDQ